MSDNIAVEDHVLSDAELITAVRRGDTAAFGVLFARHSAAATAVARRYLQGSDADDAVAGAFEKVLAVLRAGKGPDVAFRAYLFTVVRRRAVEMLEGGRRAAPTDDDHVFESAVGPLASSEDPALKGFEDRTVARAFQALPERWRSVLWYTDIEGRAPAEVAPALGMTPNAVSALAYRAREGLRQAYLQAHLADVADDDGCARTNAQLGAYVRGGLSRRESTRVEEHLESCARCRAVALELADLAVGMRATVAPLVVGLLGVAALGGLPLVLTGAGASAAGDAGGPGRDGSGPSTGSAVVGAGAGVAFVGGPGSAAGAVGAVGAASARIGSRWLVGAAAGVATLLVAGGLALGAGGFGDPAPPAAAPTVPVAPSAPVSGPAPDVSPAPEVSPTPPVTDEPTDAASGAPSDGPTTRPTAGPTAGPTPAPNDVPTPGPTARPTAEPTSRPTTGPTDAPTTAPTDAPTSPEPPRAQPPVVTVGASTVLVAGGTGVLDVAIERPSVLTERLTARFTLPLGATWAENAFAAVGSTASDWTCVADGTRSASCTLEPAPPAAAGILFASVAIRTAGQPPAQPGPTATDVLQLAVDLDAGVGAPGDLQVQAAWGDGEPKMMSMPLGAALAVRLDADAPGADGSTLVLSPSLAEGRMTLKVTNAGRALDAAVVELVIPDILAVTGDRCMGSRWVGGTTTLRCILGPVDAGETRALDLDVTTLPEAPLTLTTLPATLIATVGTTSHEVDAYIGVQVDTEHAQLRARFEGRYRVYEIGAPTIHCATSDRTCLGQAVGNANNDTVNGRVVLDGVNGRPLSTSTLSLPEGARVVGAYLTWGASYPGLPPGDATSRGRGTFLAPGGSGTSRTALDVRGSSRLASDSLGANPLGGRDFFQSTADVTDFVRTVIDVDADARTGGWSFVPDVAPGTGSALFGGWSLTVVVEEPGAPVSDVRVYDALDLVSGTGSMDVRFAADVASDVRLGATVWEGDRGLPGDYVKHDGVALTPLGGLALPSNAFDSTATGFAPAEVNRAVNSFGVDVRGFGATAVAAGTSTLTFGTEGDSYALASFSLTLTPHLVEPHGPLTPR